MKVRVFVTLALFTFFGFALVSAHGDKTAKKTSKTEHACCAEKSSGKSMSDCKDTAAKKDGSKSCCNIEKTGMKKEANMKDCCTEHEKTSDERTKSSDAKGTK